MKRKRPANPDMAFSLKHLFGFTAVVCSCLAVHLWLSKEEPPHISNGLRPMHGCGLGSSDGYYPSGPRQRIYIGGPAAIEGRHQTSGAINDADFLELIGNVKRE